MSHTPGPWRHDRELFAIYDSEGLALFEQLGATSDDARLIAAAPALLEALEGLAWYFPEMRERVSAPDGRMNDAVAAIALARGEAVTQ